MDCIVHGVAKGRTRLNDFHFHLTTGTQVLHQCSPLKLHVLSLPLLLGPRTPLSCQDTEWESKALELILPMLSRFTTERLGTWSSASKVLWHLKPHFIDFRRFPVEPQTRFISVLWCCCPSFPKPAWCTSRRDPHVNPTNRYFHFKLPGPI